MLKDERLERIEVFVNERQYASVTELMDALHISKATVRRDLDQLAQAKRLALTRGGAVSTSKGTSYELPYLEKRKAHREEKVRIAEAASRYISPGETVIIDTGTTCIEMVPFLRDRSGIVVATNDLMTGVELCNCPNLESILIGGTLRRQFYSTSGYYAANLISELHFDKAFISMDSIDLKNGCMITNLDEVDVKRAIIRSADQVIALCDHTKFVTKAFVGVCPLGKLDRIITGRELAPDILTGFQEAGKTIELV